MTAIDQTFAASFKRAVGNGSFNNEFISRFYEIFLSSSDDIARMFARTNMSVQKTMLHDSLHLLLEFYRSGKINRDMERVAKAHSRAEHDVAINLYADWLNALLQAVQEFDPQYNDEVDAAWREVLQPGIEYMQSQYDPQPA